MYALGFFFLSLVLTYVSQASIICCFSFCNTFLFFFYVSQPLTRFLPIYLEMYESALIYPLTAPARENTFRGIWVWYFLSFLALYLFCRDTPWVLPASTASTRRGLFYESEVLSCSVIFFSHECGTIFCIVAALQLGVKNETYNSAIFFRGYICRGT